MVTRGLIPTFINTSSSIWYPKFREIYLEEKIELEFNKTSIQYAIAKLDTF